jgi:predicted DNA-binding transcriptional regulator AlpA
LSKDQACTYLNISRSRFDDLVREGILPQGRKIRGLKEKMWYQDEITLRKM